MRQNLRLVIICGNATRRNKLNITSTDLNPKGVLDDGSAHIYYRRLVIIVKLRPGRKTSLAIIHTIISGNSITRFIMLSAIQRYSTSSSSRERERWQATRGQTVTKSISILGFLWIRAFSRNRSRTYLFCKITVGWNEMSDRSSNLLFRALNSKAKNDTILALASSMYSDLYSFLSYRRKRANLVQ